MQSETVQRTPARSSSFLRKAVIFLLVLIAVSFALAMWVDRRGREFFESGKSIVLALDAFAKSLKAGDADAMARAYSPDFAGTRLGLATRELASEKTGIRYYRLKSDNAAATKTNAVDEWRAYRDSFSSVLESGLHVERVEQWGGALMVAIVRFEVIGTPKDETQPGIDRARFRMSFERGPEGNLRIRSASFIDGDRVIATTPQFADVAATAGVDFTNQYYPAFVNTPQAFGMIRYGPGGITAVDVDADGFHDLFIPDGVYSRLFRNKADGTFEDITEKSGLAGLDGVSVGVFADYDNDGDKDLFVSRTYNPNQLFRNDGGRFTDVTAASKIGADCCTTVASWGDYNNDGYLDLYVGRYLDPRTKIPTTFYARNGEPNQLYKNNGDGTFTNVTDQAGVGEVGLCLGTVWGDYDDDGYLDLYVVNDFGRKTLYHNNRNGTFTDVTVKSGTLDYGAGMSASFGDYDNDGRLDLYVANIRSEHGWFAESPTVWRYMMNTMRQNVWYTDMPLYFQIFRQSGFGFPAVFKQMASGNSLLRNNGDGTFEDAKWRTSTNPPGWFWGSSFADFDNDGWLDIYSANGWAYNDKGTEIELDFLNSVVSEMQEYKKGTFFDPKWFGNRSWHGWERNRHLRSNGDGTFAEVGRGAGTDLILNSRGIAVADFWNRGVQDIAVAASTDKHALLKNNATGKHWLAVELVGTKTNRDAVGARVYARVGQSRQMREVVLGDGYGSQNTLRQHFGLGDATRVDELVVKWPKTGETQTFTNVAADRILQITEGSGSDASALVVKQYAPAIAPVPALPGGSGK